MEEIKVVVAIASGRGEVPLDFMTSVLEMVFRTKEEMPNVAIAFLTCQQTYIHTSRQNLAESFLGTNADMMLSIDDDNIPEPDALIKLLKHNLPIVSGLYFKRKPPYEPLVIVDREGGVGSEFRPELFRKDKKFKLFKAHSAGFGFVLIKREVYEKVKGLGVPMFSMRGGVGEDIWFYTQARAVGFDTIVDPSVEVGHLGGRALITADTYRDYYDVNIRKMIDRSMQIDGFFSLKEAEYIADQASSVDRAIEVGSWLGKSTQVMSLSNRLWCVDKFEGDLDGKIKHSKKFVDKFKANTKDLDNIRVIIGDSVASAKEFRDGVMDLILIDGGHDYKQVKADIEAYFPKLKVGGKMAIHDYCSGWKDVMKATDEFEKENRSIAVGRLVPETTLYEIVKL